MKQEETTEETDNSTTDSAGRRGAKDDEQKRERRRRVAAVKLQDRDRQLLGHLGVVRYLSLEQVGQLVFAGRHRDRVRVRLRQLEGADDGEGAQFIRRVAWRTFDGVPQVAWTLADAGYIIAEQVVGPLRVPARDVGAQFMEHTLALNELYARLLGAGLSAGPGPRGAKCAGLSPLARISRYAEAADARLRWVQSDAADLPWTEYDQQAGRESERVIRPDAVLELARAHRRLFLECEMGTHSVTARTDEKAGATLHKLERYAAFVNGLADPAARQTFYARRYPDRWKAEVVFLVQTAHRAETVKRAIGSWRRSHELGALQVRVDVVDSLAAALLAEIGVPAPRPAAVPQAATPHAALPELSPADVDKLHAFCTGVVATFKALRAAARGRKEVPPPYPPHADAVLQLLARLQKEAR